MKINFVLSIGVIILLFSCEKEDNDNKTPELSSISNKTVFTGESENVTLYASDENGDPLAFSIISDQGFLSITNFSQTGNYANATLVNEPKKDDEGSHNVTIEVNDGKGGMDSEDFIITVNAPPFSISDIEGKWSGSASNAYTFSLTINIDSEGNASGTGASGDIEFKSDKDIGSEPWTIDNEGKVIGYNFTWFFDGNTFNCEDLCGAMLLCGAVSKWELQLNNDKSILSGKYACYPLGVENVNIELSKQ